jgi:hypothetical protein
MLARFSTSLADQLRLELDVPESNVESAGGFADRYARRDNRNCP